MIKKVSLVIIFLVFLSCLFGCAGSSDSQPLPKSSPSDSQPLPKSSPSSGEHVESQSESLSIFDIIPCDASSITLNAYGQTVVLSDAEKDNFLDIIKGVEYTLAGETEDIGAPGAIVITVTIECSPDESTQITLPYYMQGNTLYSAGVQSITLFNGFFEEPF